MSLPEPNIAPSKPNILQQDTLGTPNWVWLVVIGLGIGAAIILPRLFAGVGSGSSTSTDTSGTSTDGSGLPVGGGTAGTPPDFSSQLNQIQTTLGNLVNQNTTGGINGQGTNSKSVRYDDFTTPALPVLSSEGGHTYIIANSFPYAFSTFFDIGKRLGISAQRLEQLNPGVDPHHIQFNEKLRIS